MTFKSSSSLVLLFALLIHIIFKILIASPVNAFSVSSPTQQHHRKHVVKKDCTGTSSTGTHGKKLLVLLTSSSSISSVSSASSCYCDPKLTRENFIKSTLLFHIPSFCTITTTSTASVCNAYDPDTDKLRESLYLISRVQEATVQQERLINKNLTQEELKQKMKLSLRLVDRSYKLLDQINFTSQYVMPQSDIVQATEAGLLAVESLQSAIDFVNTDLNQVGQPLKIEQKEFLISALQSTRDNIFTYVAYMPQDKLEQARLRIERENVDNRDEFDGPSDAGVYNPVKLPWK